MRSGERTIFHAYYQVADSTNTSRQSGDWRAQGMTDAPDGGLIPRAPWKDRHLFAGDSLKDRLLFAGEAIKDRLLFANSYVTVMVF